MRLSSTNPPYFFDLGSMNARVYTASGGLETDAKSYLLRDLQTGQVSFIGTGAFNLMEKVPPQLELVRTVVHGEIADPSLSELIEQMVELRLGGVISKLLAPSAVAVVSTTDPAHKRALRRAFLRSGFSQAILIPSGAAICAALQEDFEQDFFVLDLGAGKTELTAMSGGHVLFSQLWRTGGDDLDQRLQQQVEEQLDFQISLADARLLKTNYSFLEAKSKKLYLLGKDTKHNSISSKNFDPQSLAGGFSQFFQELLLPLETRVMKMTASQLKAIKTRGLILAGGLGQMEGLDSWISSRLALPVTRIPRPHLAPLLGASKLFTDWERYSYLSSDEYFQDF